MEVPVRVQKQQPVGWSGEETLANILTQARRLLERHGRSILIVAAAALVVLLGYRGYRNKARSEQAESWEALAALPSMQHAFLAPDEADRLLTETIQGCTAILDRHWKTDATPWVLLRLANAQRSVGLQQEALETCRRLEDEYPSHYVTSIAAPNRAGLLEEMGRFEEAALAYEALARLQQEGSTFWLDAGRNWEMDNDRDAAVRAYQMIADKEELALAASRLKGLTAGKPLLVAPPPAPSTEIVPPDEQAGAGNEPAEEVLEEIPVDP